MNDLIARNLRTLRQEQGLSFDQLAKLSGVSKSMLRQIEKARSSPTITTLWKIANGLRVPLTSLLKEDNIDVSLKAFRDGTALNTSAHGLDLLTLVPYDAKRSFEIYFIEIQPGAKLQSEPHNGTPEEYLFVTKGTITLRVENQDHKIKREHFLRFQANRPHEYFNHGDAVANAIVLITYM